MASPFSSTDFFTESLLHKLKRHPKRVVFPEALDDRILEVACELVRREVVLPILLGDRGKIRERMSALGLSCEFILTVDPAEASDLPLFCERYERVERYRGNKVSNAAAVMADPHYFGAMMVQYGQADGMVVGNRVPAAEVARPIFHLIRPQPGVAAPFGAVIAVRQTDGPGPELMILGDCSMHPEPDAETLASFAVELGVLARQILGRSPRVALLSHSTKGSFPSASSRRVAAATALARDAASRRSVDISIDGEIQIDVALRPETAAHKGIDRPGLSSADVLVFPGLDAADISLRLLRHLGGYALYGQLLAGLSRPVAQVPRTASREQILGTTAAIAVEAVKYHDLHLAGELADEEESAR